jgi:hypothetical protein
MELLAASRFDQAFAAAQEGYRLSLEVGYGSGGHLANMATVEAAWGRRAEDACRHAEQARALGQRRGSVFLRTLAEWTLGLIELTTGRADAAAGRLLALTAFGHADVNPMISLPAVPDAVEAGVRAGRAQEAAERLVVFRGSTRWRRSSRAGPSCCSASGCGASGGAGKRVATCARPWSCSAGSAPCPGKNAPRPSCGRPARPPASATSPPSGS